MKWSWGWHPWDLSDDQRLLSGHGVGGTCPAIATSYRAGGCMACPGNPLGSLRMIPAGRVSILFSVKEKRDSEMLDQNVTISADTWMIIIKLTIIRKVCNKPTCRLLELSRLSTADGLNFIRVTRGSFLIRSSGDHNCSVPPVVAVRYRDNVFKQATTYHFPLFQTRSI